MNLLDLSENRWKGISYDLPKYSGFMSDIDKFDGAFFGVSNRRVDCMDAESRVLYEHVYEAIIDAGVLTNHFYFLFFIAICDFLININ